MAEIATMIEEGAHIRRVIRLEPGDVYVRLITSNYSSTTRTFGVVQTIASNGDRTMVTAIEFDPDSYTPTAKHVVFAGDEDVTLFPGTAEEVLLLQQEVVKALQRQVDEAEHALLKARDGLAQAQRLFQSLEQAEVTA